MQARSKTFETSLLIDTAAFFGLFFFVFFKAFERAASSRLGKELPHFCQFYHHHLYA